jgi:hypothetical protein
MRRAIVIVCALLALGATPSNAAHWQFAPGASFMLYDSDGAYIDAKTNLVIATLCFADTEGHCSGSDHNLLRVRYDCAAGTKSMYRSATKPAGWSAFEPVTANTESGANMTALCGASLPKH